MNNKVTQVIRPNSQQKKQALRFYKQQNYAASFLGNDTLFQLHKNGQLVGNVIVSTIDSFNFLHGLCIAKSHRGQHHGSQLLQHTADKCDRLTCFADNELTSFYLNNNFNIIVDLQLPDNLAARYSSYQKKSPNLSIFIHLREKQIAQLLPCE